MKPTITAQQTAFFAEKGWIDFEWNTTSLLALLPHASKRDLWRENRTLQRYLVKTVGPLALQLTGKKQLHLGLDHYFLATDLPKKMASLKELVCIQGIAIAAAIAPQIHLKQKRSLLGLSPCPTEVHAIRFLNPELLLDWPHVGNDLYLVLFAYSKAVYIHNPKDAHTHDLKIFGYHFGDTLKNGFHPLIFID